MAIDPLKLLLLFCYPILCSPIIKTLQPSSDDREVYETLENKSDLVSILTNICELDISNQLITTPSATPRGFPCVKDFGPVEDGESKLGTRKKKSLFARQYDKKHQFVPRTTREVAGTSAVQSATRLLFKTIFLGLHMSRII